ncbi:EAL domain-containing protein [Luteimonas sp. M1R5S18]|uniref:EAL domain-containing protein n=1 Tax=Luteimonas rhizosphaericola TaxID=3042024 RepID=A0ABT6JND7_9GAMM|nr:EAL domain-containing protein [Luteimonas rhizosphaericola]MDH5832020.1 EAL domain-containing protein [Luteimonas rhizosphaericola]
MRPRLGLRGRFALLAAVVLLAVLAMVALVWHRQDAMHRDTQQLGLQSIQDFSSRRLLSHGRAATLQLADALVNPLYYFDLDAIGAAARGMLRQPDVSYVIVYDNEGQVIHDGSPDISTYGQAMSDPFAYEVLALDGAHVQSSDTLVDIAAPIRIGDQRLGGVRVGYSLAATRADERQVGGIMAGRLAEIGRSQLLWLGLLLAGMVALLAAIVVVLQRALVSPVRQLADAARAIEAGRLDAEVPASRRDDEVGDLMRAFAHMRDSLVRHDRDIRRMAYTDALTGLSNRLAFRELLDQRVAQGHGSARQLALLFADIDDFKRVNDTIGHDAGDEVLMQFSGRIRDVIDQVGGPGAELARFGGDEFVILLQGAVVEDDIRARAERLAEALVRELGRPITVHGRQVFLGISIGIALFPDDAGDVSALMKNGDIAMYQAKVAGKNCHRFYSRVMDQAVERRVRMEQDLRGAWERGELSLAYQPVYRLEDGRLAGAEALLRWRHPEHGPVSPSLFIDVAEQSGLIEVIGPQVLRAACMDARGWQRDFPAARGLFVSVNVSARQLRASDLANQVEAVLRETGLAPQQLHIELTETAVIGDEARVSSLLARLRSAGVKVWLDDFGTGFSGLSHLRRVPVDGVKIDRSFIADVLRDPDDLALTTAIIAMAHSLGIHVVAEGVEKEGQYAILRERGCDMAQGFWLGHPVSNQEFTRLLV